MGIVGRELGTEGQPRVEIGFHKTHSQSLVLPVFHRIVGNPLQRILPLSLPAAVGNGGEGAVFTIRIPVRKHKPGG